jgi:AAHS family 4-hydroxybenzoate transporter-like MFS transporter
MTVAAQAEDSPRLIDIPQFIDEHPVGSFQIRVMLLCAAVLFIDGFDTQAIGYVAPALAHEWSLARGMLGPVFSAGLFGLMIGALIFSTIADRIGRRRIIVLCTAAFGVASLLTLFVNDAGWLIAVRFLTGLGLGGAMPNAIALTSEFSPHRRRATLVMVTFAGFSIGAALGGLLAAALIPIFGWRSVFLAGGLAPLALLPVLATTLPESIRYLALLGGRDREIATVLRRIAPLKDFGDGARFVVAERRLAGLPVAHLFADGRRTTTVLLWVVFFTSLLDLYLLSNWLPTVINDLGVSVSAAAAIGAMLQVGGVVGTFTLGRLIDRFSFRALALTYFFAAAAVAAIGFTGGSIALATVAIFAAGFCIVGGQTGSNALAAMFYPTAIRSTGVGWALGIGRAGSIVGPLVGGVMLAHQIGAKPLFVVAAVPALIAALAALALAFGGRDVERIAAPRVG